MTPGSGGYPQTAGLRWRIQGRVVVNAQVGGQPINPGRSYRLAVNHFTAIGGMRCCGSSAAPHPGRGGTAAFSAFGAVSRQRTRQS